MSPSRADLGARERLLARDELDALKRTIWWDADGQLLIVNGRARCRASARRARAHSGTMRVYYHAGSGGQARPPKSPQWRNLNPKTALTHRSPISTTPGLMSQSRALRDMDVQGHRSGHDHSAEIDIYPWLRRRTRRQGVLPRLQWWAYEYTLPPRSGCSSPALIPMQHRISAIARSPKSRRWAVRVAPCVRWMQWATTHCMPKYEPVWDALEETGWFMHVTRSGLRQLEAFRHTASSTPAPN